MPYLRNILKPLNLKFWLYYGEECKMLVKLLSVKGLILKILTRLPSLSPSNGEVLLIFPTGYYRVTSYLGMIVRTYSRNELLTVATVKKSIYLSFFCDLYNSLSSWMALFQWSSIVNKFIQNNVIFERNLLVWSEYIFCFRKLLNDKAFSRVIPL